MRTLDKSPSEFVGKMNNGVILQAFETQLPADGSLWRTIGERAEAFASLGISALWIPPAWKGAGGGGANGYDVYDLYDLGEFHQKGSVRTKYGTRGELLAAIGALHRVGIKVCADIVLNHRFGGDEQEWLDVEEASNSRFTRFKTPRKDMFHSRFTFPGRGSKYSSFTWNHSHFNGFEAPRSAYLGGVLWLPFSSRNRVFRLVGKYWPEDAEMDNVFFGCDIDHGNSEVRAELIRWGEWFLDTTGVDGFRLDCVPHISRAFLVEWLARMRSHANRDLFAVGEYFSGNVSRLTRFLDRTGQSMELFDFPLHFRFREASLALRDGRGFDLRTLFSGTLVSERPESAVTFVDNHDTQFCAGGSESPVLWMFQVAAYAFILLRSAGRPCVFWRDLYGAPDNQSGIVRELPLLLRIRQVCAKGEEAVIVDKGPKLVGFVRSGIQEDARSGLVCIISSAKEARHLKIRLPERFRQARLRCAIGDQPDVTVGADGGADFTVGARRCAVFVPVEAAASL